MRLRYLHIQGYPPLRDVTIMFDQESILARDCAIHFVVGVNGTGKSTLLRAIVQVILDLEAGSLPPFHVTLAYDLGRGKLARTIFFQHDNQTTRLIEFDLLPSHTNWAEIELFPWTKDSPEVKQIYSYQDSSDKPGSGDKAFFPTTILAYTSGATGPWYEVFATRRNGDTDDNEESLEPATEDERPVGWDDLREIESRLRSGELTAEEALEQISSLSLREDDESESKTNIGFFVTPEELKYTLFATTLAQAVDELAIHSTDAERQALVEEIQSYRHREQRMSGLRGILNAVDWLWPVTVGLRIKYQPESLTRIPARILHNLYKAATVVHADPGNGTGRHLLFDLGKPIKDQEDADETTGAALIRAIVGQDSDGEPAFAILNKLLTWQREGILEDVTIAFRRSSTPIDTDTPIDSQPDYDDLLLYDWMSDGEQVFLGRMALFHLVSGQDDTFVVLDEPETHFNDYWKREIVDIIDESVRDDASEVLISTHSSIALTDVFGSEISVLEKNFLGEIWATPPQINSFGASPSEIMRQIFKAPDSVGQRATEFLDVLLLIAAYPDQVESLWHAKRNKQIDKYEDSANFAELRDVVSSRLGDYTPEHFDEYLSNLLAAVEAYTRQKRPNQQMITVTDALDTLQDKLGPGYYQFEFSRRLRALKKNR